MSGRLRPDRQDQPNRSVHAFRRTSALLTTGALMGAGTDGLDGFGEAQILLRRVRVTTLRHSRFHVIGHCPARLDMSCAPGPACYRLVVTASLLQTPVVAGPTSWW